MRIEKQKLLIEYLISSKTLFSSTRSIIKSRYFDPSFQDVVEYLLEYEQKYSNLPSLKQIKAETGKDFDIVDNISKDQIESSSNEIEMFCKYKAAQQFSWDIDDYSKKGDWGGMLQKMKDIVSISLQKDLGDDYFNNPKERMENSKDNLKRYPTLWKEIDSLMNGGLARSEMLIVTANSGGGKSITLSNIGVNYLEQKLNVLYLSFELKQSLINQRFDIMFSGIPSIAWENHIDDIANIVESKGKDLGNLTVKRLRDGTTTMDIRAYLNEFVMVKGFIPDVLIVDYIDRVEAARKVSVGDKFGKDEAVSQELYDIAGEFDLILVTASQQNRQAIEATKVNQSHIAGGISKTNTTDWQISVLLDENMKRQGEIKLTFTKTRSSSGMGESVILKWNERFLRIENLNDDDNSDYLKRVIDNNPGKITPEKLIGGGLFDLMEDF